MKGQAKSPPQPGPLTAQMIQRISKIEEKLKCPKGV